MGFGRQNGQFACLEVATGRVRWEYPLHGTASAVSTCDIDGDGTSEFVFGTSHGDLYALADAGSKAREVWRAKLPASVGTPIIADVDNDGASEILVGLGDGRLCLMRAHNRKQS
jgi:outer membrane protein assembly factor BamB